MSNELQEFNSGHIVEGCDRCQTILLLIDELLDEHPAVIKCRGERRVMAAEDAINNLYQLIGALDDE